MIIETNILKIIVKPNSKVTEYLGWDGDKLVHRIALKAPADKGKANIELCKFLSKQFKRKAVIISGKTSKEKLVRLL